MIIINNELSELLISYSVMEKRRSKTRGSEILESYTVFHDCRSK